MSADSNIDTIKAVYAAFGKGDVSGILDALSDEIDWAAEAKSTTAPWYGLRRGKQQVADFFNEFGSTMQTEVFTPLTYTANDNEVMTIVHFRGRNIATGRTVDMNLHHWFTFSDGKIVHYRGSEDTAQTESAFRG
jgi:uncharacterized protein